MTELGLEHEALSYSSKYYPEKWEWIPRWIGRFKASNWGRVMSCHKDVVVEGYPDGTFSAGVLLSQLRCKKGYYYFSTLNRDRKFVRIPTSHAVLEAFGFPRPSPEHVARHVVVPDPSINCLWNLEWGTQLQNMRDKVAHRSRGATLTVENVQEIWGRLSDGVSIADIANAFGVVNETIAAIRRGTVWTDVTSLLPKLDYRKRGRLSSKQIPEIRRRIEAGDSQGDIAKDYGVSKVAINHINTGKNWSSQN